MNDTGELVAAVHVDADPEDVFPYFTDPTLLTRWLATTASVDPRPGGEFSIEVGSAAARGSYVAVEPHSRIVFTWGIPGDQTLPAGSTTVEVGLQPSDGGTLVTLTHRGLTGPHRANHEAGWRNFLAALAAAIGTAAGGR